MLLLCYLLLGSLVGCLGGMLGIGGGMFIVPTLYFIFTRFLSVSQDMAMHLAIGTSLATIILTAAFTTHAHHKRGVVLWSLFWSFTPGIIIGALLIGPLVSSYLSGPLLRTLFGLFCLVMAIQMVFTFNRENEGVGIQQDQKFFKPALVIGTLSSILGIAGGSIAAMLLNWYRYSMRNIIGTTAAIGLPVAICGTIGFIVTGWQLTGLPRWSSGYIYWPAFMGITLGSVCTTPLGAYLAHKLPVHYLKKIFAVMLAGIAVELIVR